MRIKELRKISELTQAELAERLGVDRSTIAKWECGFCSPRAEMLPQIAKELNCSIQDIYSQDTA